MSTKRDRFHWLALLSVVATVGALGGAIAACGSDSDVAGDSDDAGLAPDGSLGDNDGAVIVDAGFDAACLDASPDAALDCSGKCGPVKDPCTGKVTQCGGCANATDADGGDAGVRVCDLETNSCIVPKTKCSELGAECGTVKNSCGEYLDCPDTNPKGCAAGKECDPDTHKCRDCQAVTCKDLGYECGSAWLGCGEDTPANQTDCGSCAADSDGGVRKCNAVFHTCEPSCVPKTAAVLCEEAKAKKGVECGVISNGCGGTVNCDSVNGFGCKNGESCGVRGIANRCDVKSTPDECKVLGKNCGTIKSACSGATVKCGDCPDGEVCNENGVCGAPCTPKKCSDFAEFECGTFDDTCGSTVTCGSCPNGVCNDATKSCCDTNTCSGTYGGKCGQDLANGCGQNVLDCNCGGNTTCTTDGNASPAPPAGTTGMCCAPRAASYYQNLGQCGNALPNGCGANNVNAACLNGGICVNNATGAPANAPPNGVVGSCCAPTHTCGGQGANKCNQVQNSCRPAGQMVSCNGNCSTSPGTTCTSGTCCVRPVCSSGTNGEGAECNVTKPANGCGADLPCNCAGGRTCWCGDHQCAPGVDLGAGVCKSALTCSSPAYNGKCGTDLSNGIGGKISCGCGQGRTCSTSTPGDVGECKCNNGLAQGYNCSNVPDGPSTGGNQCGAFDNGCGGTLTCTCANGQTCNTAANPNVCCTPAVCPAKALGSACGNLSNNCGGTMACGCPTGAGNENFACTNGTCQCTPDTCRGRTGSFPDRCGGTLTCGG